MQVFQVSCPPADFGEQAPPDFHLLARQSASPASLLEGLDLNVVGISGTSLHSAQVSDHCRLPVSLHALIIDSPTDHTLIEADMIDLVYLRQRAAVHSRMKKAPHLTMDKSRDRNEEWRRFGMARRQEIVEQDALVGGNHFEVNPSHPVERYFELADRVVHQFRTMVESLETETLERTFIMGHRLVSFLSEALPCHPQYMDPTKDQLRSETIRDLVWIQQRLDEIAYKIDEEQLNHYITDEYVPEHDENDDSTTCSSSSSGEEVWSSEEAHVSQTDSLPASSDDGAWESFEGWSMETPSDDEIPPLLASDQSFDSSKETTSLDDMPEFDASPLVSSNENSLDEHYEEQAVVGEIECDDPGLDVAFVHDDDDDDDVDGSLEYDVPIDLSTIQQAVRSSAFLRMVAEQDVPYEWDSDASDSWAQDLYDEESDCSVDSGEEFTCDPARIALRDIRGIARYPSLTTTEPERLPSGLTKSLTFDEEMPDDEATWSAAIKSSTTAYASAFQPFCDDEAPDDEAGSWTSFSVSAEVKQ